MKLGYVSTFMPLQYAMFVRIEYVCPDGHRIRCRTETIDWQTNFCWC
jgi:hypothetical protein